MAQQIVGNRILGGIGSPGGGLATGFGQGVSTALDQRTSRQQMQERDQAMRLREQEEARRQQAFAAQQAAAARARATEAARLEAMRNFFSGETTGAGVTPPSSGISPVMPSARPSGLSYGGGAATGGAGLSFGSALRGAPPPGMTAGPMYPVGSGGADTVTGGAGTDTLTGAGGGDRIRVPRARQPRVSADQQTPLEQAAQLLIANGMSPAQVQSFIDQGVDLNFLLAQLPPGTVPSIDAMRPEAAPGGTAEGEVERAQLGVSRPPAIPLSQQLTSLLPPPTPEQRAAQSADVAAQFEAEGETADAETSAYNQRATQEYLDAARTTIAGVQMPFAPPVQTAAALNPDAPSERYLNNADLIQMDRNSIAQQMDRLERAMQYYTSTGDATGYQQLVALTDTRRAMDQLAIEQRYLDGMVAISAIGNGNFGPLQYLLQQRPEFQGRQVEVRPYDDGTVEIFVDGRSDFDGSWESLVSDLRTVYDQGYQQMVTDQMTEIAQRERYRFEQMTQAERDILTARAQAAIAAAGAEGQLDSITDAEGIPLLQYTVNGVRMPVTAEIYVVEEPGVGQVERVRLRRIDTGEVVPLTGG